ncbi:HTH domain-containing protein [Halorientalis salina]|uniref:HTH domain-containing protein n=1 Tax=Halorientalis salina TaxID=2932266 RepID=UPI0010ACE852|nr:HTH domain-containing protein [Halorientalis salina]
MTDDEPVRVELYVRSLLAGQARSQQDEAIERLAALEDAGVIDESQLVIWGRQAPASPAEARTDAGVFARNRVTVFSEWASANGLSVEEQFQRRTVDSAISGETYRAVRFPVMTLAEYHGKDLTFVAPANGPETTYAVQDRLDTIEMESRPADRNGEFQPIEQAYAEPPHQLTLTDPEGVDVPEP